jgi:WD40 repeat protein
MAEVQRAEAEKQRAEAEKERERASELAQLREKAIGLRAVSPDQTAFVSSAGFLIDAKSNDPVAHLTTEAISVVQFSPDGSRIVLGTGHQILVFDRSGAKLKEFAAAGETKMISFAPDSKEIAVVSLDGSVALMDLDGHVLSIFKAREPIRLAAFSADKTILITALQSGELRAWDVATGALLRDFAGLDGSPPTVLGVGTDSRHGLAVYRNGRAMVFDFKTGETSTFLAFTL